VNWLIVVLVDHCDLVMMVNWLIVVLVDHCDLVISK